MPDRHPLDRPDCERAHSLTVAVCSNPGCDSLHIIALRAKNDEPIVEIVLGRDAIKGLLAMIHDEGLDL